MEKGFKSYPRIQDERRHHLLQRGIRASTYKEGLHNRTVAQNRAFHPCRRDAGRRPWRLPRRSPTWSKRYSARCNPRHRAKRGLQPVPHAAQRIPVLHDGGTRGIIRQDPGDVLPSAAVRQTAPRSQTRSTARFPRARWTRSSGARGRAWGGAVRADSAVSACSESSRANWGFRR